MTLTPEQQFARDKREEAHDKIRSILQDYNDWFQPDEEDQQDGWSGPFLLNDFIIITSFLDNEDDEWVSTFRPRRMTQSQRDGMMHRALFD